MEPEGTTPSSLRLTVQRTGGTAGVVGVSWTITADNGELAISFRLLASHRHTCIITSSAGDDPTLDIAPRTGSLQFVSNVNQQQIVLSILPDNIPEIIEVV